MLDILWVHEGSPLDESGLVVIDGPALCFGEVDNPRGIDGCRPTIAHVAFLVIGEDYLRSCHFLLVRPVPGCWRMVQRRVRV